MIEFRRLPEVDPAALTELSTHPLVRRHMPLSSGEFDPAAFVAGKERLWVEHGYGPWALFVDGRFAGWGGLQPEGEDADLGLVLHPDFWGLAPRLYHEITRRAFGELGLASITVLLPPDRPGARALARLGFRPDGEVEVGGVRFLRSRLRAEDYRSVAATTTGSAFGPSKPGV